MELPLLLLAKFAVEIQKWFAHIAYIGLHRAGFLKRKNNK